VAVADLRNLTEIYADIIRRVFAGE
jgi:hypothetical protein